MSNFFSALYQSTSIHSTPSELIPRRTISAGAAALSGALLALSGLTLLGVAGCGVGTTVAGGTTNAAAISGAVHGGQQPIAFATVSLIAPGTGGYGTPGTVIVSTLSNAAGQFTLPQPYTCPANSGLVYLLATGGDAGAGLNTAVGEAAILGPCNLLTSGTFVSVSEVTTVAAAYALAPFATVTAGSTAIGTSSTNLQGLYNAAGTAGNLANISNGFAHATGDAPGIVPPTAELNTLANILASCINQGTTGVSTGTCASLFSLTTPSGGVAPTDTFQAALNIAKNPARNTSALFALAAPSAPFQPTLAAAPGDFSVALGFNGGAITSSQGTFSVGIDAGGNAWISTGGAANVHSLTEISPAGVYLSGATVAPTTGYGYAVLSVPLAVSIDPSGSVFVANGGAGNIVKFNAAGAVVQTITATSLTSPNGLAVDGGGNLWAPTFSQTNNKLTKILPSGVEASNSPFTTVFGGVEVAAGPLAIWESDYQSKQLSRTDLTTFAVNNYPLGLSTAGVAIDHGNNAWFSATGDGNLYKISDAGVLLSPAPAQGGFVAPNGVLQNVTIDGLGNAFAGGYLPQNGSSPQVPAGLFEFTNAGTLLSGPNGFYCSGLVSVLPQAPGAIDVDGSGNVWIAGSNNGSTLPNYVTEVVGIGAPVVTPKSVGAANNTLGTRP